jgi:hypothetical protein
MPINVNKISNREIPTQTLVDELNASFRRVGIAALGIIPPTQDCSNKEYVCRMADQKSTRTAWKVPVMVTCLDSGIPFRTDYRQ